MDCISHDETREVVVKKSARVGYTKMLDAAIGYNAQHRRRNQCLWQPTDEDAEDFVKAEIDTMLRDVPIMRSVFPENLRRDSRNTLRAKRFLGSTLYVRGGKTPTSYRRISIDNAYLDELAAFDRDIGKEGSPRALARKRLEGSTHPKLVCGSTPKEVGSLLDEAIADCDRVFDFNVPCPSCGVEHPLGYGMLERDEKRRAAHGMHWHDGDPETAHMVCPHCRETYTQADYLELWELGRWIDGQGVYIDTECDFRDTDGRLVPVPRAVGFRIWTAYSPQAKWRDIVDEYLKALDKAEAGDSTALKTFVNTTLGESWEEKVQKADADVLRQRAEDYPLRECPRGVLLLTAGVDVQDRRFEVDVWGWGRGEESWLIDHMVIECNPADSRDWDRLDDYLKTRFAHASGQTLPIEAVGIDTGGHFTHEVYNFCRVRTARRIYAVKGSEKQGQPIKGRSTLQDVNYRGAVLKGGVRMHYVGTDTAKDLIFGRIEIERPGPGYVHLCKHVPDDWFDQFTAEARVPQKVAGGQVWRWVAIKKRNEALDTCVYATFAAHMMDLPRYTDSMWSRIEDRLYPMQGDLLAGTPPASAEVVAESDAEPEEKPEVSPPLPRAPAQSRRPGGNWANRWRLRG